jgi:hypothetical protein
MRRKVRSSSWKSGATTTSCVPETMWSETSKFDPLTRFMNYEAGGDGAVAAFNWYAEDITHSGFSTTRSAHDTVR